MESNQFNNMTEEFEGIKTAFQTTWGALETQLKSLPKKQQAGFVDYMDKVKKLSQLGDTNGIKKAMEDIAKTKI